MASKDRPTSRSRTLTYAEGAAASGILPATPREENRSQGSTASRAFRNLFPRLGKPAPSSPSRTAALKATTLPGPDATLPDLSYGQSEGDVRPSSSMGHSRVPQSEAERAERASSKSTPRPASMAGVRPRYDVGSPSRRSKPRKANTLSGPETSPALPRPSTSGSSRTPSRKSSKKAQTVDLLDTTSSDLLASTATEEKSSRRFSFAEESLPDIAVAIRDEVADLDWLQDTWKKVLFGSPAPECKALTLRSLHTWLEVYNRWQALGGWIPGQAPIFLDAYQFQETVAVPMLKALDWVKLFDPVAHAKLHQTRAAADYRKVKVSMPSFFTAAVFLSNAISKRQKVRFLLGVFDINDSRTFEMAEFVDMLSSFFQGIACAFNLQGSMPTNARRQPLARQLFLRILESAKIRPATDEVKYMLEEGSILFPVIEDWFLGLTGDPLSIPFALFLERFSVRGLEDDPEVFEEDERKFRLSHSAPVNPPMETAASLDSSFLRRSQMKVVRALFSHCESSKHFAITHAEAETIAGTSIEPEFWIKMLSRPLEDLEQLRQDGVKFNIGLFFKKLCPRATARHLRMFQTWLKELSQLEELEVLVEESRRLLESFQYSITRPVLPAAIRQELMKDFNRPEMREMAARNMSASLKSETEGEVAKMSKDDFIFGICPKDYRPKDGNPLVESVVCHFLTMQQAKTEELLAQKKLLFAPQGCQVPLRSFLKQEVPESSWTQWNQVFDMLSGGEDHVTFKVLADSRLLPPEVCRFLCSMMASNFSQAADSFSREEFLQKLVDISEFRRRNA